MPQARPQELLLTQAILHWLLTNAENFDELYSQLKRLARLHLSRERQGHTLQPTALVHEALLRIKSVDQDPQQFFRLASAMMRRILIDHARSRKSSLSAVDLPTEFHPVRTGHMGNGINRAHR
ncbi:MAG: hypothetical protein FJW36_06490 [Acidobacteria bacterium]|nr:hypothetical protein [Acidobacteriota bacterium]